MELNLIARDIIVITFHAKPIAKNAGNAKNYSKKLYVIGAYFFDLLPGFR